MTARHIIAACALLIVTADAASGQITFAYRYDAPTKFSFVSADTVVSNMETPMGALTSNIGIIGKYNVELTPKQDSTHVKFEVSEFGGTMEAMGQSMPIPQSALKPIELMIGRTGPAKESAASAAPAASLGQLGGGAGAMTMRMFVRLPEQPVRVGATWTDSINASLDSAGMKITVTGLSTNTYAADTTVNGRRMHRVHVVTDMTIKGTGNVSGQDMTQDMKAASTADWLWDPQRRIFVEMLSETTTTGTMTMAAMGAINMNAKATSRMKLAES